ncbi:LuxR family transcriptional regulator [Mariniluteicoccus endophyticus]
MQRPIAPSTIRPGSIPATLLRPRLLARLDEATRRQVTLLIAPVGYGKRTLVDQWIAGRRERVVRLGGSGLTARELRSCRGGRQGTAQVVVIEDAHLAGGEVLDAAMELLDHDVHLLLTAIGRPPLSLGALTIRGEVSELNAADLALDRDEARTLLETAGPVPDTALDIVMETSLGWPAALRVLAENELSWDREASQTARLFSYFSEAVHPVATAEELELLKAMSILPSVTSGSAQALTGDSRAYATLASLVERGWPATRSGASIRMHPLVRRHLVGTLVADDPVRHRELVSEGVSWLSKHGDTLGAIRLALDSGIPIDAGALLRQHFLDFLYAEDNELRRLVGACADAGQLAPWEAAAMQSSLLAAHQEIASDVALGTLSTLVPDDLPLVDRVRLAGFQLFVARQQVYLDSDISAAVATADETADITALPRELVPHLAFLQVERALHLLHIGQLDRAHGWAVRGLTTARLADLRATAVQALAALAWITGRRGGVAATRRIADEALMGLGDVAASRATSPLPELAWLAHALVDYDLGDLERGDRHLAAARRCSVTPRRETAVLVAQLEAMRAMMQQNHRRAIAIVEQCRSEVGPLLPAEDFQLSATHVGALLIADDDRPAALEVIEHLEEIARPEFGVVAHYRAHYLMRLDRFAEAYALLDPILQEGDVVIEKEWLQMLMACALAADRSGRPDLAVATFTAADELAARLGMDSARARQNLGTVERRAKVQFTDAERHLLHNLTPDESIKEIAERLYVSPNTVKTHLRRIYAKLAVSSREDAIERARVLRIL